jgi:hypothetical protein
LRGLDLRITPLFPALDGVGLPGRMSPAKTTKQVESISPLDFSPLPTAATRMRAEPRM